MTAEPHAEPTEPSIAAFDCTVDDEAKEGARLRGGGPGPYMSQWNWFGPLRCWIRTVGGCQEPKPDAAWIELGTRKRWTPSSIEKADDGWNIEFVLDFKTWFAATRNYERERANTRAWLVA